jgi:hypothetical protein
MAIDEASFPADENIAQNGVFLLGNIFSFITLSIFGMETCIFIFYLFFNSTQMGQMSLIINSLFSLFCLCCIFL